MEQLLGELHVRYERNVPMGSLTWYGTGGCAQVLAHPSSVQQLSALAARCREAAIPVRVLGSGANLLVVSDVAGIVVKLDDPCFDQMRIEADIVTAGAGYALPKLVLETAKAALGGLHVLSGIPASIGGAVRMNAGGTFGDIGGCVRRVQVMDGSGQVYYRDRDDLVFAYRKTNIVAPYILEVEFELAPDDPNELVKQVKEIFLYKKNTQPVGERSAGCVFKNPAPPTDDPGGTSMPGLTAGELIDQAGLKGYRAGGAEVSQRHANFIVAHDGCTASEILAVIENIETTVCNHSGVRLERELVVWD